MKLQGSYKERFGSLTDLKHEMQNARGHNPRRFKYTKRKVMLNALRIEDAYALFADPLSYAQLHEHHG